jgi:hypothetical protein
VSYGAIVNFGENLYKGSLNDDGSCVGQCEGVLLVAHQMERPVTLASLPQFIDYNLTKAPLSFPLAGFNCKDENDELILSL